MARIRPSRLRILMTGSNSNICFYQNIMFLLEIFELCLPGVEIVGASREIIFNLSSASQLPGSAKFKQLKHIQLTP